MTYIPTAASLLIPSSFATRVVAHHEVVDLPGGPFVMGSSSLENATPPHWVRLSPFGLGTTVVTEGQFQEIMGHEGNKEAREDLPATYISWNDAQDYFLKTNERKKVRLRFATEAEWECGARGPAVNLLEVMEQEKVKPSDFAEFAAGRFENFVREIRMSAEIFTDPEDRWLRKILQNGQPLYAWRVHGTPSGRLTRAEAWFDRWARHFADWGPANGYGLKGMTGGVWEWVGDWYAGDYYQRSPAENPMGAEDGEAKGLRGGSWGIWDPSTGLLHAACRFDGHPAHSRDNYIGFRVAVALQDSKEK